MKRIFIAVLAAMFLVGGAQAGEKEYKKRRFFISSEYILEECILGDIPGNKGVLLIQEDPTKEEYAGVVATFSKHPNWKRLIIVSISDGMVSYRMLVATGEYYNFFNEEVCHGEAPLIEFLPKK